MTSFIRLLLIPVLILLMGAPAYAQSRAELAAQNAALRERVDRLEARMLTGDPAAERLMSRIDTLEATIRTLRGEIERLSYEAEISDREFTALQDDVRLMQDQSTAMKIQLDEIARGVPSRPEPQVDETYADGPATLSPILGPPEGGLEDFVLPPAEDNPGNDASQMGETGKIRLAEEDYAGAEAAFIQYLQAFPDASDAGEIHYWLGESYFVRGRFNAAAESYVTSLQVDQESSRAPDALVKLAAALREMGQPEQSCAALASFDGQYPNASQASRDKAALEASRTGC
ncbi:tol-pal system protein YbgF [Algimonas porphyrae]|uniref:Cell division coordinator CpoB n=1 Tax=Algimonas porphyrae TaxID=1128113 RepID=A0ABQ5UY15_9PROT|nr:tol-pal system protein YbgF [Algimonas porphyrae]GLQ20194.1 tol-pal system protein YbgF [Algimonas porphyrae]